MSSHARDRDDELPDSPFVRALQAPGTAAELQGGGEILQAFRDQGDPVRSRSRSRSRSRWSLRAGLSSTSVAAAVVLSGGVAAAYTAHLPAPLQRAVHGLHHLMGPIAPPAPSRHHTSGRTAAVPKPSQLPAGLVPGQHAAGSDRGPDSTTPARHGKPSPAVTLTLAPPASPAPAHVQISVTGAAASGRSTLPRLQVQLQVRVGDAASYRTLQTLSTDAHGHVRFASFRLGSTTTVRLYAPAAHTASRVATIVTTPKLGVSSTTDSSGVQHYRVTVEGARPRETVYLLSADRRTVVQRASLDEHGRADLAVAKAATGRPYVLSLKASAFHGSAQLRINA